MRVPLLPLLAFLSASASTGASDYLSSAEEAKKFHLADPNLQWDLVLAEPDIAQPVFMNWDERGRLWVCEYRQYPAPAGLTPVSHDDYWRTVYDKVPPPPPQGPRGADRITIHEDTDGDGRYDRHTVFLDGLNLCTAVEHGRGGHFVLQPPYLLFYADRDRNDVPDGPPEVLLSGFGIEDTHSLANSLRWGPDGWLYGAHGSTVTSRLLRPGLDAPGHPAVTMIGQAVWRYNPETKRVEVFAEGGGNTFGLEFDAQWRLFSGHNGGNTRGFYYVEGAYEMKGFEKHGELSNPYAYGYYEPMRSSQTERFTHNFIFYEGGALGPKYEGKLFGIEPLQGRLVLSERYAIGSAFGTKDLERIVTCGDPWFRPVDIKAGPDGAIYVADFHEPEISHLKHRTGPVFHDTGRIWRLKATNAPPAKPCEILAQPASLELFEVLLDKNKWRRQTALRLIADHRGELLTALDRELKSHEGAVNAALLHGKDAPPKASAALAASWNGAKTSDLATVLGLEALHPLQKSRSIDDDIKHLGRDIGFSSLFLHSSVPEIREWAVRILADRAPNEPYPAPEYEGEEHALESLAEKEPDVRVRLQLAASARRLPAAECLAIIRPLMKRDADAKDPRQPLMLWWALESKCATDRAAVLKLFEEPDLWNQPLVREHILGRLMRRFAEGGTQPELLACARLLDLAPTADDAKRLLAGFEEAFHGRSVAALPEELARALAKHGGASLPLRLRLGEANARAEAVQLLADPRAKDDALLPLLPVLAEIRIPEARTPLLRLLDRPRLSPELESALYPALQPFDDTEIGARLVERLEKWARSSPGSPDPAKAPATGEAFSTLATRPGWSLQLAEAVKAGRLPKEAVPLAIVRRLKLHREPALLALADELWPGTGSPTTAEMEKAIAKFTALLHGPGGDPYRGRDLFTATCAGCHRLHGDGGQIGPDLTTYQRTDLSALLTAIVNPSGEIREGYENFTVTTRDGRTLAGFLSEHTDRSLTLRGLDGQTTILPRDQVASQTPAGMSLMPPGLLNAFTDEQVRDLFAYLRSSQPLPARKK